MLCSAGLNSNASSWNELNLIGDSNPSLRKTPFSLFSSSTERSIPLSWSILLSFLYNCYNSKEINKCNFKCIIARKFANIKVKTLLTVKINNWLQLLYFRLIYFSVKTLDDLSLFEINLGSLKGWHESLFLGLPDLYWLFGSQLIMSSSTFANCSSSYSDSDSSNIRTFSDTRRRVAI